MTIAQLEPQVLWSKFYDLTQIPRPSKHEEKAVAWVKQLASEHNFDCDVDAVGNLKLTKAATAGYEDRVGVVLQSHIDMVCQANADTEHDFFNDPIQTEVRDGWVHAKGTTLGADNGIGVATIMAIFCSTDIEHGPLEALITIDEEAGMTGAHGLEGGWFNGDQLINLDSEEWGEFCIGCAGGIDVTASAPVVRVPKMSDGMAYRLSVKGLKGGHSGVDIHRGRGNANKLAVRVLRALRSAAAIDVIAMNGGTLRNAIPREAFIDLAISADEVPAVVEALDAVSNDIKTELSLAEPVLDIELQKLDQPFELDAMNDESVDALMIAVESTLSGVERWSDSVAGVVETSNNLAVIKTDETFIQVQCLIRSLVDSCRDELAKRIMRIWEHQGATTRLSGAYPGWKPSVDSSILKCAQQTYRNQTGDDVTLSVIHAGLECGLFAKPYPNWQMVSLGPDIRGAHSPDERVEIASVANYWSLLLAILVDVPVRR